MIPKKIHYIWFGRKDFPQFIKDCIQSWRDVMPDYEIILWNEDNYDYNKSLYTKQAYECGKYAFVSDYARLEILYNEGGIYFDTDVRVLKRFDEFLKYKGFSGFEGDAFGVNPGIVMGAEKGLPILQEIMALYNRPFILESGEYDLTTIVHTTTRVLHKHGLKMNGKTQNLDGFIVYERDYFAPPIDKVGTGEIPEKSFSVHLYAASWVDPEVTSRMKKPLWKAVGKISFVCAKFGRRIFGENKWNKIRNKLFKGLHDKMKTVK